MTKNRILLAFDCIQVRFIPLQLILLLALELLVDRLEVHRFPEVLVLPYLVVVYR